MSGSALRKRMDAGTLRKWSILQSCASVSTETPIQMFVVHGSVGPK